MPVNLLIATMMYKFDIRLVYSKYMTDTTSFGDRMKLYEGLEADRRLLPLAPVMARLDGRAFHTFTQGLDRPYDRRMVDIMRGTTQFLVAETQALIGYTQSDEISLVWYSPDIKSQIFFDGRISKMTSILAAICSVEFNRLLPGFLPENRGDSPVFDCRVWTVPTKMEAANTLLWREQDATRNSVSAAAQSMFSHKELQGKNTNFMQEMLFAAGINWNDYPAFFKRGTWTQKRRVIRPFTTEEIEKLPAKHEARKNPGLTVERWNIQEINMPQFSRVANRVEVVFDGVDPVEHKEDIK